MSLGATDSSCGLSFRQLRKVAAVAVDKLCHRLAASGCKVGPAVRAEATWLVHREKYPRHFKLWPLSPLIMP